MSTDNADTNGAQDGQTPQTDAEAVSIEDLEVAWSGGMNFAVWSEHDGQDAYDVDLRNLTCSCDHGQHNRSKTAACRHIKKAIVANEPIPNLEHFTFQQLADLLTDAHNVLDEARQARDVMQASQQAQEASVNGNGSQPTEDESSSQDDDDGLVSDANATKADEELMNRLEEWFEEAAGFNGFDPDILRFFWVDAGGTEGIKVDRYPFDAGYYDTDESEWVDKDGFQEQKDAVGDSILSPRDEFQWYGEPDYCYFIAAEDVPEVVGE